MSQANCLKDLRAVLVAKVHKFMLSKRHGCKWQKSCRINKVARVNQFRADAKEAIRLLTGYGGRQI